MTGGWRAGAQEGDAVRAMLADKASQGLDWVFIARPAATGPGRPGASRRLPLGGVLAGSRFAFTLGPTRCVLAPLLRLEEFGNTARRTEAETFRAAPQKDRF